jgi:hypothetical protein
VIDTTLPAASVTVVFTLLPSELVVVSVFVPVVLSVTVVVVDPSELLVEEVLVAGLALSVMSSVANPSPELSSEFVKTAGTLPFAG